MKYCNTCRVCKSNNIVTHGAILSPFLTFRIFNIMPTSVSKLYNIGNGINYFPCLTIGCKQCNYIGCNVLFDDDEMITLYKNYIKDEYIKDRRIFEPSFTISQTKTRVDINETQDWILGYMPSTPISVIDFGSSVDTNTPFKNTSNITLVDIGQSIDNKTFDLLTCLHVLEHVPDIQKTLSTIFTFEFKYAYFEVPYELLLQNYSSLEEQVENKEFWHEHINFFNLDSFSYLFKDETVVASRINNNIIQLLLKKT